MSKELVSTKLYGDGLELKTLRYFVAVAQQLHFSRAAEDMGISPPQLTRQIQRFERKLGIRLLDRSKRKVTLTVAGELFFEEALEILERLGKAVDVARRAERGEIGKIEVGYVASAAYSGVLQRHMSVYRAAHPGVEIRFYEMVMSELPHLVVDNRIDVAFLRPLNTYPPGVSIWTLLRDRFWIALPNYHHLVGKPHIYPSDLVEETFVLPEQESGTFEVGRRGNFEPRLGPRPGSLVAVATAVSLGVGISIIPGAIVGIVNMPGVIFRELAGEPVISELAAVFRKAEKAPAIRAMISQLMQIKINSQ